MGVKLSNGGCLLRSFCILLRPISFYPSPIFTWIKAFLSTERERERKCLVCPSKFNLDLFRSWESDFFESNPPTFIGYLLALFTLNWMKTITLLLLPCPPVTRREKSQTLHHTFNWRTNIAEIKFSLFCLERIKRNNLMAISRNDAFCAGIIFIFSLQFFQNYVFPIHSSGLLLPWKRKTDSGP